MQSHATIEINRVRKHARCAMLLAWLCACVCVSSVRAQSPCDDLSNVPDGVCPRPLNLESARGLALGTGARASSLSTSALAYNPAALVVGRVYHLEGIVDYMADMRTVALGGTIVDSSTSRLSAGVSFRGFLGGQGGLGGIDGRVGLAFPISEAISLGVSGRYINAERKGEAFAALPASLRSVEGFTLDASLRVVPIPILMLYGGGYNLISLDSVYTPLTLGGGASVTLGNVVVLGADVLVDMSSYDHATATVGGGLEFFAAQVIPLRAGYIYDTWRTQHTLSFGLGYTDRSMGLDVSLRQDLGGIGDTRVLGAFRLFVH